ncbi:AAA family ATPase [Nitrospirillum sp. BR 11828]|uniref:AAA family ATPase n=1 Tax=Nitrospirillum sp. BR 11828 TaxID=3104325 RepID=UPI002ACA1CFB|nr:AAA family ATPase [Nitrospirillum sp. BR 11828]MDZ5649387.1 AAA family ATPase [Nitrospirillum sp. BR 11828]
MSSVSSLTITGFKSIRSLRDFKLNPLNVLIGANGAGKSNFIGFFRLLSQMYLRRLQLYVQTQGGPDAFLHFGRKITDHIYAEVFFQSGGYKFNLIPTADNRLIFEEEIIYTINNTHKSEFGMQLGSGHTESNLEDAEDIFSPVFPTSVKSLLVYHFHDTGETARVKQPHAANINLRLETDAGNLAAYLTLLYQKHPQQYRRIVETIRLVAPFFGDFVHRDDAEFVELEWTQAGRPDTPFKAHMLSDGTLRFICLATLLLQPTSKLPDTILIDEPELGLHPYAISVLADMFKQVAEQRQLIVSTQSVELVNELTPEDIIVVDQEDGASTFKRYSGEELAGWLQEYSLGEIWKRNILGGRP